MTFTNRLGQDVFIRFNVEDQEKTLRTSHSRVSFMYREAGPEKLQVLFNAVTKTTSLFFGVKIWIP